jgi:hypothetical protein
MRYICLPIPGIFLAVHHLFQKSRRYNLQEYLFVEKLLDKRKQRTQIGKRAKQESVGQRVGGAHPNDRFIPEAVVGRMFASLTLSSRRLS